MTTRKKPTCMNMVTLKCDACAAKALEEHTDELDDVPLKGVNWEFNKKAARMAQEKEPTKTGIKVWELFKQELSKKEAPLPADVVDMMMNADLVCSLRSPNMELEEAQHAIGKVLDRTEAVLAQVVSEHW